MAPLSISPNPLKRASAIGGERGSSIDSETSDQYSCTDIQLSCLVDFLSL